MMAPAARGTISRRRTAAPAGHAAGAATITRWFGARDIATSVLLCARNRHHVANDHDPGALAGDMAAPAAAL
jgi:hypothetical protein